MTERIRERNLFAFSWSMGRKAFADLRAQFEDIDQTVAYMESFADAINFNEYLENILQNESDDSKSAALRDLILNLESINFGFLNPYGRFASTLSFGIGSSSYADRDFFKRVFLGRICLVDKKMETLGAPAERSPFEELRNHLRAKKTKP